MRNDKKSALSIASSGQQEALPLLLVLRHEIAIKNLKEKRCIIIEEPEAHLFPKSQKMMVELIFETTKRMHNTDYVLTTHSPYILACANYAALKDRATAGISAYFISDGKSKSIHDADTLLIDGEDLDRISDEIADEFESALGDAQ